MQAAPTVSSTSTPDAPRAHSGRQVASGLRLRALIVAIPLLVGICFLSVYADMVAQSVQFGVLQFAPPAIVALFVVALVNKGLSHLARRELLNQADVLVIYAMTLVGVLVSTRGVIEKLIPPLAYCRISPRVKTISTNW
jgi:uncharacterized ion transporter superfamily protein YfcC